MTFLSPCRRSLPCLHLRRLRTGPESPCHLSWRQVWFSGPSIRWWSSFTKSCEYCQKSVSLHSHLKLNWAVKSCWRFKRANSVCKPLQLNGTSVQQQRSQKKTIHQVQTLHDHVFINKHQILTEHYKNVSLRTGRSAIVINPVII